MEYKNLGEDTLSSNLVDHLHHPCDCPPDTDWYAEEGHGLVTCLNSMYDNRKFSSSYFLLLPHQLLS